MISHEVHDGYVDTNVSSVRAEIFRDDFNDGDSKGWTFVQGDEDGGIQNGELVLGSSKAGSEAEVTIAADGIIASDYEMAVSLKISRLAISGGAAIGLRAHTDPRGRQLSTKLSVQEAIVSSVPLEYQSFYDKKSWPHRLTLLNLRTVGIHHED